MGVVLRAQAWVHPTMDLHNKHMRVASSPDSCLLQCSSRSGGHGSVPCGWHCSSRLCETAVLGRKNPIFPVLKEISEMISVKRIRSWAVQMCVSALSVSVTNPSCRAGSLYWLTQ